MNYLSFIFIYVIILKYYLDRERDLAEVRRQQFLDTKMFGYEVAVYK